VLHSMHAIWLDRHVISGGRTLQIRPPRNLYCLSLCFFVLFVASSQHAWLRSSPSVINMAHLARLVAGSALAGAIAPASSALIRVLASPAGKSVWQATGKPRIPVHA
jgi:hypothetical protein